MMSKLHMPNVKNNDDATININNQNKLERLQNQPTAEVPSNLNEAEMISTPEKIGEQKKSDSSSRLSDEILLQIFGQSVGSIISDHSCSYERKSGRLYIGTNAGCFYSNLFGFEHRFMVQWSQVQAVEQSKTNGIYIFAVDQFDEGVKAIKTKGETSNDVEQHEFKGFLNREDVLSAILDLCDRTASKTFKSNKAATSPQNRNKKKNERNLSISSSHLEETEMSIFPLSRIKQIRGLGQINKILHEIDERKPEKLSAELNDEVGESLKQIESKSEDLWSQMIKCCNPPFKETALNQFKIGCTMESFFENFLADNAPYSHEFYHTEKIGDTNVETSPWQKNPIESMSSKMKLANSSTTFQNDLKNYKDLLQYRQIRFHHKIKTPIGKSIARGIKYQTLYIFPKNKGIILDCKIDCSGVHASDCFYVEERWIVESILENNNEKIESILLTTKFEVRFVKNTLWKGVIEKMTSTETKSWCEKYGIMLKETITGLHVNVGRVEKGLEDEQKSPDASVKSSSYWIWRFTENSRGLLIFVAVSFSLIMPCCIYGFLYLSYQFDLRLSILQDELNYMRIRVEEMEQKLNLYEQECSIIPN